MSTKTIFKRISLVTIAALGFGVLTSVAPASAATITPTAVTIGTIPVAQIGVVNSTPITVTAPFTTTGSDTFTVSVRVMASPAGSAFRSLIGGNTSNGTTAATTFAANTFASGSAIGAKIAISLGSSQTGLIGSPLQNANDSQTVSATHTSSGAATAPTTAAFSIGITPDIAGTYTILVSTKNVVATASAGEYAAGDANASYTFTTGGAVANVILAAVTGSSTANSTTGQLIKATITSSAGAVAQLGINETISITDNSSVARLRLVSSRSTLTTDANATVISLTSTHFVNGVAYFFINSSAVETIVITATGSGLLASTVTSALSVATKTRVTPISVTLGDTVANAAGQAGHATLGGTSAAATSVAATTATTHSYLATITAGTAGDFQEVTVTDTAGKITGVAGLVYTYALASDTTTTATVTIAAACTAVAACFTATVLGNTPASVTVTAATAAQTTVAVTSGTPTVIKQAHGGSSVLNVIVKDQFRAVMASQVVTISTTGRNASTSSTTTTTDSSGVVSYTRTDAGTSASTNTQDVVTFTVTAGSATVTINYVASGLGATTIELATPTTDDTTASGITYSDIDASSTAGASASTQTITATVKDVNGAILVGVPVTFTTASAGAAVRSTSVTVYTGATGTAAASVYGWTAGVKTFTATAGAKSVTGTVAYRQGGATGTDSATEARTISAVATGNKIVVTATDRFGNVVSGVPLWGTRTGNGTFGSGSNTNGQTTGVDGTAEFLFNAGSEDSVVKITAGSATAAPLPCYAQTGFLVGMNVCSTAATQTAYTASTVGTASLAETGIGASFAPAGVSAVTVAIAAGTDTAQAAADAAAEATDAANAATDAANAAAEAADAATAAAQDASDAVAALSTQVAEQINALKMQNDALRKQLVAITNLIIKIQKKVKA